MNYSGNGDFTLANGNSMDLGAGESYGTGDGSRPASATWMFTVLIWRI